MQRKDDEQRSGLLRFVREGWSATVGRFMVAEGEGTRRLVQRMVELGKISQDEASNLLRDFRTRIESNGREIERRVEESLGRALPRRRLEELRSLLDRLESRLDELEKRS